ncbi:MAG TPA: hypothetical protein PLF26_03430 [Blastocatellia bacterium]|nr:hypothetical protein [Blastocatellia bacterium]
MAKEMTNPATSRPCQRRWFWLLAFLLSVVAAVVIITPVAPIKPFKAWMPARLELA